MNDETPTSGKKIFIDEDWKSRVEAEKEAARQAEMASHTESQTAAQPDAAASTTAKSHPLPPADLGFLIGTLYLQGAMALGLLPTADGKARPVERESARHVIDLLDMLMQKTECNRTPDETAELEAALHELRLAFVAAR